MKNCVNRNAPSNAAAVPPPTIAYRRAVGRSAVRRHLSLGGARFGAENVDQPVHVTGDLCVISEMRSMDNEMAGIAEGPIWDPMSRGSLNAFLLAGMVV